MELKNNIALIITIIAVFIATGISESYCVNANNTNNDSSGCCSYCCTQCNSILPPDLFAVDFMKNIDCLQNNSNYISSQYLGKSIYHPPQI